MSKTVFKKLSLVVAVGTALALSGCATEISKQVESEYKTQTKVATDLVDRAAIKVPAQPLFSKQAGFYVEKTPLPQATDATADLPPIFKRTVNFDSDRRTWSLQDLFVKLNQLSEATGSGSGLLFTASQDIYEADPSRIGTNISKPANQDSTSGAGKGGATAGAAAVAAAPGAAGGQNQRVDVLISDLKYKNGSLAGLLDTIATKTNLAWRYDGERVHFFRYDTRIFTIDALAGTNKTENTISSQGSAKTATSGGGGATTGTSTGSTTSSSTESKIFADVWSDVSSSIQSQLTGRGKMSVMQSTGQVAVTDTPDQLRRIQQYVNDLNRLLGKQISFNVEVYSVNITDEDSAGLDWNLAWKTLGNKYGLNFANAGNTQTNQGKITLNLFNGGNGSTSNWNGSQAVVGALSSIGKTTLVTSSRVTTLNNITVPVSVIRETAYLESMSTTVTGTSGISQTSLSPGLVTTGFVMGLTPRVSNTDKITVQFSMNLANLINIPTFTAPDGKSAIQLPERDVRNALQQVKMRSGETVILSGFQQTAANLNSSGIGDAKNWLAGGAKSAKATNTTLVILITPYITE